MLDLTGVAVRFDAAEALVGLDLHVREGERVALVGSSGAGKSSVLAVASGLVTPTSGDVTVLGTRLDELAGRRLRSHRRRVGIVGQHLDMALSLRVVHNVNAGLLGQWSTAGALWSLVRPARRAEALGVLDRVGLADRIDARSDELSGGERQRVAVARVLRQRPDLVLADEPTSSVDPRLADEVMGLLCGPPEDAPWTVVVSVHDPQLARRHATRIVGLHRGSVAFDLPPDEVTDADLVALYRSDR